MRSDALYSDVVSGVAGAMAVANSATNPFVFLLFNVKWPFSRPSAARRLLGSHVAGTDPVAAERPGRCTDTMAIASDRSPV